MVKTSKGNNGGNIIMGDSKTKNRKYYIVNKDNTDELLEMTAQDNITEGVVTTNNKMYTSNGFTLKRRLILVLEIDDNIVVLNDDVFSIDILVAIMQHILKI